MNDELREDLLGVPTEYLCPNCGGALRKAHYHDDDPHVEIWANFCTGCGRRWPIKVDVAVLVPDNIEAGQASTIDTFAKKWTHNVEAMRSERRRIANPWFLKRFGFGPGAQLLQFLSGKRRVLDAGCGLGNLTELFARLVPQDAVVYGVDLSPAVFRVQHERNIRLVQGDITQLPIAGEFDLIVADGVLHHTVDTKYAMHSLLARLAPGGHFLFYVYKRKAPIREFADDFLRARVGVASEEDAMTICEALADLGRELCSAGDITIHKPIEALGIPAGTYPVQRFVYWFLLKAFYDDVAGGDLTTSMLENYDWYRPKYAWRHTREEVEGWVAGCGVECVSINEVEAGFAVTLRKPRLQVNP